jgi:hypothetical protein
MVNLIRKIEAFTCSFVYVFSIRNLEYTGSLTERSSVGSLRLSSTEALHRRSVSFVARRVKLTSEDPLITVHSCRTGCNMKDTQCSWHGSRNKHSFIPLNSFNILILMNTEFTLLGKNWLCVHLR